MTAFHPFRSFAMLFVSSSLRSKLAIEFAIVASARRLSAKCKSAISDCDDTEAETDGL
jgi:hypothetical protein